MQLRRLTASTIFICSLTIPSLFADEASRTVKVQELFRVAQIQETLQQQMAQSMDRIKSMTMQQLQSTGTQMTAEQTAKAEQLQTQIVAMVQDAFSWEKLKPELLKIYVDTYTDEELDGLITFYKSAVGQAFVTKTPILAGKTMEIVMQRMVALQPQMQQLMKQSTGGTKSGPTEQQ